jgi:predicted dithiol-disulfide oxidoreductase (DUF899 family)
MGKGGQVPKHALGTREEWQTAREELREREEEIRRLTKEVAEQRRQLPWVPVDGRS